MKIWKCMESKGRIITMNPKLHSHFDYWMSQGGLCILNDFSWVKTYPNWMVLMLFEGFYWGNEMVSLNDPKKCVSWKVGRLENYNM